MVTRQRQIWIILVLQKRLAACANLWIATLKYLKLIFSVKGLTIDEINSLFWVAEIIHTEITLGYENYAATC